MNRIILAIAVAVVAAILIPQIWTRVTVHQSGHGILAGDTIVLGEYGYSEDGDRLRYAIFRTWPEDSTPEERLLDPRRDADALGWPLIRDKTGRMVPVGHDGDVYFFDGDTLKTMKVRMNEHTDMIPLDSLTTVDAVWGYLKRFDAGDE